MRIFFKAINREMMYLNDKPYSLNQQTAISEKNFQFTFSANFEFTL